MKTILAWAVVDETLQPVGVPYGVPLEIYRTRKQADTTRRYGERIVRIEIRNAPKGGAQ